MITQIPAPRVPFIDDRSGQISREWYLFLLNLFDLTGGGSNSTSLIDLQQDPTVSTAISQIYEIEKKLDAEVFAWISAE